MTNDFRIGMRQIYDEGAEIKKVLDESLSSENSQLLVQALNGDISPIKLPPELKITYTKLRGQIDANANKLIEAGALDKKFKIDDYVKRIYKEDVESRNAVGKMYFNSRFKARKNLTHDERIALGMIEDATLVIPKTLAEQRAQLLKANTLKNIADKFGKDEAFDGSVLISDQTNGGGVYKYGALAGKYVPKEVADAVVGAGIVKENLGILERLWFPLIDHIKVNVTVKNPFTHVYNVGSNLSLAYLHGDFGSLTKVMSMMVSDKAGFKALVQRANRLGLNSYLGEMEIANPLHNADKDHAVLKILKNMYLSKDSKLGDMARKAYDWEDKIFKLASFHRHLSEGMDEKMAMKLAQESYVDYYTPLPGVVRMMDKSGLMPFLHYSDKSTPMVLRAIAKNPRRCMIFQ